MDFNAEIYRTYATQVFRYLMRLTGDAALAEELTQETFYQAVRSMGRYNETCKISVWLCQIAKNSYYKYLRAHKRQPISLELIEESELSDAESCEQTLIKQETDEQLRHALEELPEPYKQVIVLRIYHDLSYREIGATLGKSESWARVTFYRGKERLREVLGAYEHSV